MRGTRHRELAGQRIGVFGKGGSGKSTVSVLLARALRGMGHEVVVLDADSTNVGLAAALGVTQSLHPLVDHFGGMVFSGGSVTCPVDDPTPLPDPDLFLTRIPDGLAARNPDGIWLLEAGKIGYRGPGAGCDGPIAKVARDIRFHTDEEEPVTLTDFKAGFEDSARGVITTLDWAVVVVDPNRASIQMAGDMKRMVEQVRAGVAPATRHLDSVRLVEVANDLFGRSSIKGVLCVLNKIPDEETERLLRDRLAREGIEPIGVIHAHRSVATSWLRGTALDSREADEEARVVCERLIAAELRTVAEAHDARGIRRAE